MKKQIERLRSALFELAPRERVMVTTGAVVVAVTLLYLLIWEPMATAHRQRAEGLQSARMLSVRIEQAAAQITAGDAGRSIDRNQSLVSAVDQTSRSPILGKTPSRLQPEGDREVKIWFEDVPFANLLRWLQDLETRYGITTSSAEIERGTAPGLVSARLTLVRE